eukprot:6096025-Pleurochrysis_carterae.AAC.1
MGVVKFGVGVGIESCAMSREGPRSGKRKPHRIRPQARDCSRREQFTKARTKKACVGQREVRNPASAE